MENLENELQVGMMVETPNSAVDGVEMYDVVFDDLGEERLTTNQVVQLAAKPHTWCCGVKHCRHTIRFTLDQLDAIPFLILRHLERIHQMNRSEIEATEPDLRQEIANQRAALAESTPDNP